MKTNKRAAKYKCKAEKKCPVCQRVFTWRKKWQRDWDKVIYCSKRCQNEKRKHD